MAAALTAVPTTAIAKQTLLRFDVTDQDTNEAADPFEEIRCYIKGVLAGQDDLVSHQFACNADGKHSWFAPVIPAAGTWTFTLNNVDGDGELATTSVVAS